MSDIEKKRTPITPLSEKGWPRWAVYIVSITGLLYLLFPSFGLFELIPDAIPIVGSLDEASAAIALWYGYIELRNNRRRRRK